MKRIRLLTIFRHLTQWLCKYSMLTMEWLKQGKRVHVVMNIILGFILLGFFHWLTPLVLGQKLLNVQFDHYVRRDAALTRQDPDKYLGQVVYFDIDHLSYKSWGKPAVTPRDQVADMIQIASESGAKVIILDILLNADKEVPVESDRKLRQVLENIKAQGTTKIVFATKVDFDKEMTASVIEDLIDDKEQFFHATPLGEASYDFVCRFWIPYQEVGSPENREIIWSIPVLAAVLSDGDIEQLHKLRTSILKADNANKTQSYKIVLGNGKEFELPVSSKETYLNRIRFFHVPSDPFQPGKWSGNLSPRSVHLLSDGMDKLSSAEGSRSVKGKTVVIGNSSPDKGDIHMTPLGPMPGMYIQGNAINTLAGGLQSSDPEHGKWSLLLDVIVTVIAAFVFAYLDAFSAKVLISVPMIIAAVYSYELLLSKGYFLNYIFPVIGICIHEQISGVEHILGKFNRKSPPT